MNICEENLFIKKCIYELEKLGKKVSNDDEYNGNKKLCRKLLSSHGLAYKQKNQKDRAKTKNKWEKRRVEKNKTNFEQIYWKIQNNYMQRILS